MASIPSKSGSEALKSHYSVTKLLLIGLVFHLVYIGSVFDCYFTSPVIHGMKSYGAHLESDRPPAKRLVLIVGDGLRADLLFNLNAFPNVPDSPKVIAPHLRSIIETRGAFGISHTRVPTESRPGHVAIIGGMYEDVSAVTKGWKTNPVDFDSVFNRSSTTFSFGSPDILPMFAKGAAPGKVKTWSYDEDEEDFTKDATALDIWVLDQLKTLLQNATTDSHLMEELRGDQVVFFLHLLGLDTTGHSYRPHSKEYMDNIRVVDDIVRDTEKLLSDFFQDDETSFVFTADHGMSVIGNHGDGHPDSTRTPLIAWGRGVRGPLPDASPSSHDEYSKPWGLQHLYRRDVEQADIASLMATLIGIDWPVNSVGVLPDVDPTRPGYLDAGDSEEKIAKAALVNAKVILEQYRVKHELKKTHALLYKPFSLLSTFSSTDNAYQITNIDELLAGGSWSLARQASLDLIRTSLDGLHYLQTYDRFLIRAFVTAAYVGWAAYSALYILRPYERFPLSSSRASELQPFVTIGSWTVLLSFWTSFTLQRSPWTFYLYIVFPCYFWRQVLVQIIPYVQHLFAQQGANERQFYMRPLAQGVTTLVALLAMVAGYTHRSIWSLGFFLTGVVWPLSWRQGSHSPNLQTTLCWVTSCLVTSIFPLLPVDKTESLLTILLGGAAMLLAGWTAASLILRHVEDKSKRKTLFILFVVQTVFLIATMAVTLSSVYSLRAKQGLPLRNQIAGWILLVSASAFPFLSKCDEHTKYSKILMYFLGFGPCFIILSISVEGLFYVSYTVTLASWVYVEDALRREHTQSGSSTDRKEIIASSTKYHFKIDDLRIALFFLFFVQVGFFGTGNVASISSFYLAPVYRLIPIFNPFYMSTLLLFKIIAPYIMLSVIFAVLNDALGLPPFSLLLVALTITDGMTLTFFYQVQDTGSWLEIGQSITFFCIASLLLLWSAGISAAGEYLMGDILTPRILIRKKHD